MTAVTIRCVKVLVVEDDDSVARALRSALEHQGHDCTRVSRGSDLLRLHRGFDAVLLDLGLADGESYDSLRQLRQVSDVPVLIVSARGDERSVVRGLHLGADDFLVKPVRLGELLARLSAATRRRESAAQVDVVRCGDLEVDLAARTVRVGDQDVSLTTKEFGVLAALAKRPGEAVRKEQVLDEVWGNVDPGASRSCDVHLTSLRSKLGRPGLIETIRGYGYRLGD